MTYDEFTARHSSKMPKARKAISHPEDEIQKACVKWFKEEAYPQLAPLLFHPNNEPYFGAGKTQEQKARAGARAKSMGVTAGVADLILLVPGATAHALCIEMKSAKGRQDKDTQEPWQRAIEAQGYRYEICRSLEQFQVLVESYLGIAPRDTEQAAIDRIFGRNFKAKIHR